MTARSNITYCENGLPVSAVVPNRPPRSLDEAASFASERLDSDVLRIMALMYACKQAVADGRDDVADGMRTLYEWLDSIERSIAAGLTVSGFQSVSEASWASIEMYARGLDVEVSPTFSGKFGDWSLFPVQEELP